jgi:thiamine biosynthesis lipoprotein
MNSNVWQSVPKPCRAATGLLAGAGLMMAAFSNPAAPSTQTRFEFSEPHMGTLFRIVLYAPSAGTAATASRAAFDRVAALDDIMSDYRADSELMRMCRQAGGPPVKVSGDLFRVLVAAQNIAARSDGAFDVTVGPVVRLWRAARRSHHLPDAQRLAEAESHVGYQRIRLDPEMQTVQLLERGMLLDLGGIAKGYAADAALAVLRQGGINCALVAGGGDIALGDPPPGKEGWSIGIASLDSPPSAAQRCVLLRNAAISTSGDAEQHVEIAGLRYSHIVDPKTGQALTGRRSATLIAPNCTTSDALATAVCVLGPKRGAALIESLTGTSMLMVIEGPSGIETYESRFPIPAREPDYDAR